MGLFGRKQKSVKVEATLLDGNESLAIVGESHYQDALWREARVPKGTPVRSSAVAVLVPEPNNPHDRNAIAVYLPAGQVGYLSRDDAAAYIGGLRALMAKHDSAIALRCEIIGGGQGYSGDRSLGVWLYHDPADFGLRPTAPPPVVRTGGAMAGVRSWSNGLPDDSLKRITYLRKVLATEQEPLDRHFTYSMLEETLYKCRTVFPTALDEYEETARAHDAEMPTIIPALVREFNGVPTLTTYKQMTILKVKAKDDAAALWWATRGLDLYGAVCITDAADDLRARIAKLQAKVGLTTKPAPATEPTPPTVPAGWHPDPHRRADLRYWDGARWTEHVSTAGVQSVDRR